MLKNNFYVLTGGPGSGKTTLIEYLGRMGYNFVPEVGRKIIREQLASGGSALPWSDTAEYSDLMLQYSLRDYISLSAQTDIFFFDRGIPDILGYTELINLPGRDVYIDSVRNFRYNPTVFILPPWEDIYSKDTERKQDFGLAMLTYHTMKKIYRQYGYQLIEIPCMSVAERSGFIVDMIG